MSTIKLGQKCRDTITGFEGTAIAITEWISGCRRVSLQPRLDKDGKIVDAMAFDEPQLKVIEDTPIENPTPNSGGPRPNPTQAPIQRRPS